MHDVALQTAERAEPATTADSAREPQFDRAALLERCMESVPVMQAVLAMFLAEATESLRALHAALHRGNFNVAFEVAYTLKGAAANAGASAVERAAEAAIDAAGSATTDALLLALGPLETAIAAFRAAVARDTAVAPAREIR